MDEPVCRGSMEPKELYNLLDRFFRENKDSHNVEYRWLADQSIRLKGMAYDLGVNGIATFRSKYSTQLADHRLLEIEDERSKIAKADKKLQDEADRVKREKGPRAA